MSTGVKIAARLPESKGNTSVSLARKPDVSQSKNASVDRILFLQRTIGNRAVERLMKSGTLQAKLRIGQPGNINRYSDAAKVECDVKVHPDDLNSFLLKKSFRTVGTGKPYIVVLKPELKNEYPCSFEALMEHENQHIKNSSQNCQNFKKCVDENSSKFLGFIGAPKISYEDFVKCHNKNHGGSTEDCIADEKSAYEEGIKKANNLLNEKRCAKEKKILEQNISYWERIKSNAPNCKK